MYNAIHVKVGILTKSKNKLDIVKLTSWFHKIMKGHYHITYSS